MKFLISILLLQSVLFSEKVEMDSLFFFEPKSLGSVGDYNRGLSCDEVKNEIAKVKRQLRYMRDVYQGIEKTSSRARNRNIPDTDLLEVAVALPFITAENVKYENLELKLKNLQSLKKKRCYYKNYNK